MTSMNNKEEHLEEEQPSAKNSQIVDSTKPKPKLHDDILIMIVEKVFFQKPEGDGNKAIDFRYGNPYTFFMAHKPITETAFITQFAKLRRMELFQNYKEPRTIEFYKDEQKSDVVNQQDELFLGPWRVSNMLLEEIIRRKKLRVNNVFTQKYLRNREACELGTNASGLEAFCVLFLGKNSMNNDYHLAIKKLEMHEYCEDIKKNFEAIHAINSKELVIDTLDDDFFSVCSSLPRIQITADKTIKITIKSEVEFDEFVSNSMMIYANFVIETCPNLAALHFDISTHISYGAKEYAGKLNTILSSFMNEFLKPLDKGHSELKICLTWYSKCNQSVYETFPQDHELLILGTEFTTEYADEPEMARIIKVADAKGREHECILKIFVETFYLSDSSQDSSDDDSDADSSDSSDDDSDEDSADFDDYSDSDDDTEEEIN